MPLHVIDSRSTHLDCVRVSHSRHPIDNTGDLPTPPLRQPKKNATLFVYPLCLARIP